MRKLLTLLVTASISLSSFATTQPLQNIPDQKDNIKSGKQIAGMTFVINNYKQFKDEWENSSFNHPPHASPVSTAKVGDTVHLITLFSNCLPNKQNQCNMSFKVRVFRDDNVVMDSPTQSFKNPHLQANSLQLSPMVVGSNFESNEVGKYRYEVTITDDNAHETLNLKTYLTVFDK